MHLHLHLWMIIFLPVLTSVISNCRYYGWYRKIYRDIKAGRYIFVERSHDLLIYAHYEDPRDFGLYDFLKCIGIQARGRAIFLPRKGFKGSRILMMYTAWQLLDGITWYWHEKMLRELLRQTPIHEKNP